MTISAESSVADCEAAAAALFGANGSLLLPVGAADVSGLTERVDEGPFDNELDRGY
jgi:hypothetical protein